ncbi:MAG: pimeloyl-ACP methyl ester esterase BioH [Rhodanobacteraceae bacterium]|nr:pimeloyl-ACP methyl ester esterase BioH [Rhodanobacteraceae bacterium]
MHSDTYGQGGDIPIVLIHGWAMHGGIMTPLVEGLVRVPRVKVHVVDLPGHGYSRAGEQGFDVAECVERLTRLLPPGAIWVGWSLGGLVALRAALTPAAQVAGLGMICASPCFVSRGAWTHGVPLAVLEQFGRDLATDYQGTIERFLALEAQGDDNAQACLRELRAHVFDRGQPSTTVLEMGLYALEHSDYSEQLSQITCPSLWVPGGRDRLVPWQAMEWSAEAARGRFHRIDGAAHAPFVTHLAELMVQMKILVREVHGE